MTHDHYIMEKIIGEIQDANCLTLHLLLYLLCNVIIFFSDIVYTFIF